MLEKKKRKRLRSRKMIILIGRYLLAFGIFCVLPLTSHPQIGHKIATVNTGTEALIIGLDVLNEQTIWASGTNATLLKSQDGGRNWQVYKYAIQDSLQFRAVKALSAEEALVMSAGEGSLTKIFKFSTTTGWELLYQVTDANGFLDAIELLPDGSGIAYGDAIDEQAFILKSDKNLNNWKRIKNTPEAAKGEGGFASSGTNIAIGKNGQIWIGTGAGGAANVLYSTNFGESWIKQSTPMIQGTVAGITAIRHHKSTLFIAGGDLSVTNNYSQNLFISTDDGQSWLDLPQPVSKGAFYGSAMASTKQGIIYLICGPAGADYLNPITKQWINLSRQDLWTAEFVNENTALIAGRDGEMIRVTFTQK